MKRFLLIWALFLCSLSTAFAQFSGSGSGTEDDPYLIFNAEQLSQMRNFLGRRGVYFKLMSDIDLSNWIEENNPEQGWLPIGVRPSEFCGILDGNGHRISNVYIRRNSTSGVGFFGYTLSATIQNLTLQGSVEGYQNVGGICGAAESTTFKNCKVNFDVKGSSNVGSVAGSSSSSYFTNCEATSSNLKGSYVGGLVGSDFDSEYSFCEVTTTNINGKNAGGLIGSAQFINISSCNIDVTIEGQDHLGGLIGGDRGGKIGVSGHEAVSLENNKVRASIIGTDHIGGLIGGVEAVAYYIPESQSLSITESQSISIKKCAFYGSLFGNNGVGGLIGDIYMPQWATKKWLSAKCNISNSYSICNINAKEHVGGLLGLYESSTNRSTTQRTNEVPAFEVRAFNNIDNSFYSGTIYGQNNVGGIVGTISIHRCEISNSFSLGSICGANIVGGILGIAEPYIGERQEESGTYVYSCASILASLSATNDYVGRVIGKIGERLTCGGVGSSNGNLALASMIVSKAGIVQDLTDNEQNGTKTSSSALKLRANYVAHGWDFNNDWTIQETESYPYKPWQAAPPQITSKLVSKETTVSGKSINGGTVYIEIGDSFKSSVACNGNRWSFSVPPLQSGDLVRVYAIAEGKNQSPYTDTYVEYPGSGTLSDPYRVYTAADLQGVYKKGYYKMMNDINLTEWINKKSPTEGWPAIGKEGLASVYFDGNGHTVSGLWCNTTAKYNGLFSNFPNGYIKNLNVTVAEGKEVRGGDCTGIVIGRFANGIIDNVTASGATYGSKRSGGIVGVADGLKINNSTFDGTLKSDSVNAILGGIAGEIQGGEITRSRARSTIISSNEGSIAGALVGKNYSKISSSYANGDVKLTGKNSYSGGLVGQNQESAIVENCYSTADVTSTLYAAGLVAYNYGKVNNSYCKGNVNSEFYGAGVVGYNDGANATVDNLVAANPHVNVTDMSGWSIRVLGGFKNGAPQPGENNYALNTMILSVNSVPKKVTDNILDGYAKTVDELKSKATYEKLGWSFSRVWKIDEGKDWPTLDMTVYGLVTSVTLDQKTVTLKKGQTVTLKPTVKPDDATNKTVVWSSSDTSIATVKDGVVRGIGNGKATIIATSTDGTNLSDSAIVTVYAPVNDTIVLKDTTTLKNKTIMYPVYLNNEDPVCSFQLDVYLPDGMDIAKNSKGKYDIQFVGRQEDTHSITSNKISTGAVRVIAFSIANDNFSGKSGALINIPITIGDVTKGDYNISIRNIVLADASEKEYYCQDANGVIHVNDVIMGDANSDGKVSLADVNSTVNYIAEKPSGSFCFAAADMNNNGIINVSDVNAIVNVLAEVKTPASAKKNFLATANEVTTNDKMYCSNITVAPGGTATLPVNLENSGKYCSFQFDILLPKGITVDSTVNQSGKVRYSASLVTSRCVDHSLTSNLIRGNRYRVIVFSLSNTDVEGANGPVVNIKLKAEKDAAEGDYTLKMERVVLATADEKEYYPADSESTVTVSANTGVNSISIDPSSVKVYDLQGRKVNKPTQGVYIVNGKKVVIK